MAKVTGPISFTGKIGGISFYKHPEHGWLARRVGGPSKSKIANHPNFESTRKHNREFTTAAKAAKLLRIAILPHLDRVQDSRLASRLFSGIFKVLQTDPVNSLGERRVEKGNLSILEGFRLTQNYLRSKLSVNHQTSYNRLEGIVETSIDGLEPVRNIYAPDGATHFRIVSIGAGLDFEKQDFYSGRIESELFPLSSDRVIKFTNQVSIAPPQHALVELPMAISILGIHFYTVVNGEAYRREGLSAFEVVKCF